MVSIPSFRRRRFDSRHGSGVGSILSSDRSDASRFQPALFATLTLATLLLPTQYLPDYRDLVSALLRFATSLAQLGPFAAESAATLLQLPPPRTPSPRDPRLRAQQARLRAAPRLLDLLLETLPVTQNTVRPNRRLHRRTTSPHCSSPRSSRRSYDIRSSSPSSNTSPPSSHRSSWRESPRFARRHFPPIVPCSMRAFHRTCPPGRPFPSSPRSRFSC